MLKTAIVIRKQLKQMENKLYFVTRTIPNPKNKYAIVSLKIQEQYFDALNILENGQLLRRVPYNNILDFGVDNIITNMKFSDGTVCFLEQWRDNLEEILKDFSKDNICIVVNNNITFINNWRISRTNNKLIIKGYKYDKLNEIITKESYIETIDLNEIVDIQEEYYGEEWGREVKVHTRKRFLQLSCV